MSDLDAWLATRRPSAPPDLVAVLRGGVGGQSFLTTLTQAGSSRLDEARGRLGRVRESAFRLLEADALFTYACEAALEADDPEAALRRILSVIGS